MDNEKLVLLYQQGDKQALESIIAANDGIVKKLANKFLGINKMIEFDDMVQAGTIGLVNAANKYDNDLESKASFITYAFPYIKREIFSCVNGRSEKEISNNKLYKSCISLDIPIQADEDIQLRDTIESIDYGFENVEERIYTQQLREELEDTDLKIITSIFFEKVTNKDMAAQLNVSKEFINRHKRESVEKIADIMYGYLVENNSSGLYS